MCEYIYENGHKCDKKALKDSNYCSLHIPFEEGELLYGEKIKEIKEKAFQKKLEREITYFEGVYLYNALYNARISNLKNNKSIIFKDSHIKTLIIDNSEFAGVTLYNCTIENFIIFETTLKTLLIQHSIIFGANILKVRFYTSIYIRDSQIKYIMMNSFEHVKEKDKENSSEGEYEERYHIYGRVELFNLQGVRKIGINSRYPLLKKFLEEKGIKISEVTKKHAKARILVISSVKFDENPRFKRQVRILIKYFSGQLLMENLSIPGHVQMIRIKLPEFVHIVIYNNLVFKRVHFYSDITWNLTVLPNLTAELTVYGYILIEDCCFNNPYIEEIFYRLARINWEKSGDNEKADIYYYHEMVARRKQKIERYLMHLPVKFRLPQFRIKNHLKLNKMRRKIKCEEKHEKLFTS